MYFGLDNSDIRVPESDFSFFWYRKDGRNHGIVHVWVVSDWNFEFTIRYPNKESGTFNGVSKMLRSDDGRWYFQHRYMEELSPATNEDLNKNIEEAYAKWLIEQSLM